MPAYWDVSREPETARYVTGSFARLRTVLLLGNYRPTLTVTRALGRAGYRVMVGRGSGEGGAEFSRHTAEVWDHPPLTLGAEQNFLAALSDLLERRVDISVICPIAEEFVIALASHPQVIPAGVALASPSSDTVKLCADKVALLERAGALGIGCEPWKVASSHDELLAAANEVGFPVVVRPLTPLIRLGHKKALIFASGAEFTALFPQWPAGHEAMLVQRKAEGERHNVFFAARHGQILRAVETRILRTDQRDGTGLAVDGETVSHTPRLLADTARLVESIGYTGIGLAQFIVDRASGRTCLLELNARIAGSHAIAEQSGAELSRLAIELAVGAPAIKPFSYRPGLRYAWTYGDLGGLKKALTKGDISISQAFVWLLRALRTFMRARRHMTWQWTDPLPTLVLYLRLLPGLARMVGFHSAQAHGKERHRAVGV